jgi:16S rRNA processing protein RimM
MTTQPIGFLEIGKVTKPHGLVGEVVVELCTNLLARVAVGSHLVGVKSSPNKAGGCSIRRDLEVVASRPHQGRFLVAFAGVPDRNAAENLRGTTLFATPINDDDALFIHDLIGKDVFDKKGNRLGVVTAVEANPASDLLVIDNGAYVPVHFLLQSSGDRLVVDPPEGLIAT